MSSSDKERNQRANDEKADRESSASQASGRRQSRAASKRQTQETKQRTGKAADERQREEQAAGNDDRRSTQAGRRPVANGQVFDPSAAIKVERLRLVRRWREAGLTYSAIYAYSQVMERYPCTGASRAAAEELLEMAKEQLDEDRYYTALGIFNRLEELA
ncbi:hypothetical protein [Sphaerobacter thermophilus]|uniref:Uncharacterized protein n=1 Tax=Sphaerobacter thermophilus (strain ATCC 49802 / DSM 20745 / KCCM 41009 / NCIMB 13125 / S 6022) TaxID=479434 RepID=D1C250_SPHTD|nr:hypothetical protein [Sphaerobacter thermophilus]ACZ38317.1 hypothetical protein Sthe_0880 [Sphaerobacter thermophilus DSM 20745]